MAVEAFPAGVVPSAGSREGERAHVVEARFGDGYAQRAKEGPNSVRRTYSAVFTALSNADADVVLGFFRRLAGASPFAFTPPGGDAGKWVCKRWSRERVSAAKTTVRGEFEEDFS